MNLNDFLAWAATSGGAAAILSIVLERIPAYQALGATKKSYIFLAGTILLSLGAWAMLTYCPPDILAQLATPAQIIGGCIAAWLAGQGAHGVDKRIAKTKKKE